jgi:hypothetical protein
MCKHILVKFPNVNLHENLLELLFSVCLLIFNAMMIADEAKNEKVLQLWQMIEVIININQTTGCHPRRQIYRVYSSLQLPRKLFII